MSWLLGLAFAWVVFVGPWHETWIRSLDGSGFGHIVNERLTQLEERKQTVAVGPLRIGVGKRDVTRFALGLPLAGYGHRAFSPSTGVADPIFVKALIADNGVGRVVFLTGDLLLINQKLVQAVSAELARRKSTITPSQLYFGATHTHSGPCGCSGRLVECLGMGWPNQKLVAELARAFVEAIDDAEQSLAPAEFLHRSIEVAPELIRNRTRTNGPTNRMLDVLVFRKPGQTRWLASLIIFSAHATCCSSQDKRISSDYPGVLTHAIESHWGGTSLFFAGGVGSMAPGDVDHKDQQAQTLGTRLFKEIGSADLGNSNHHWQRELSIRAARLTCPLPAPQIKLTTHWRWSPIFGGFLLPSETTITGVRLGSTVFLGMPADFHGGLAAELRAVLPGTTTVVTSFAGDYIGYVIDDADYDLPKYEPRQMTFFDRHFGDFSTRTLRRFAKVLE